MTQAMFFQLRPVEIACFSSCFVRPSYRYNCTTLHVEGVAIEQFLIDANAPLGSYMNNFYLAQQYGWVEYTKDYFAADLMMDENPMSVLIITDAFMASMNRDCKYIGIDVSKMSLQHFEFDLFDAHFYQ